MTFALALLGGLAGAAIAGGAAALLIGLLGSGMPRDAAIGAAPFSSPPSSWWRFLCRSAFWANSR